MLLLGTKERSSIFAMTSLSTLGWRTKSILTNPSRFLGPPPTFSLSNPLSNQVLRTSAVDESFTSSTFFFRKEFLKRHVRVRYRKNAKMSLLQKRLRIGNVLPHQPFAIMSHITNNALVSIPLVFIRFRDISVIWP